MPASQADFAADRGKIPYHGLERKIGTGHLDIKVTVTDSHLIIMISDDGVGIEKGQVKVMNEQLRALRLEEENNGETGKKGGIAVKNVNNRIKLLFGEEYGIYIYSQPDVGTWMWRSHFRL